PLVEHLGHDQGQHHHEAGPDRGPGQPRQEAGAQGRPGQDAEGDGGDQRDEHLAPFQVDEGAGQPGDTDHEVTGGGGDLDRQVHGQVHGRDLEAAAADAEEARHGAGADHQPEAEPRPAGDVAPLPAEGGVVEASGQAEAAAGGVLGRFQAVGGPAALAEHDDPRPAEDAGEDQVEGADGQDAVEPGAEQRPGGGRHAEEDADADVGQTVPYVRRGRPAGGGDDGHDADGDGVADVDA